MRSEEGKERRPGKAGSVRSSKPSRATSSLLDSASRSTRFPFLFSSEKRRRKKKKRKRKKKKRRRKKKVAPPVVVVSLPECGAVVVFVVRYEVIAALALPCSTRIHPSTRAPPYLHRLPSRPSPRIQVSWKRSSRHTDRPERRQTGGGDGRRRDVS